MQRPLKLAEIKLGPERLFFYVQVPQDIREKLETIAAKYKSQTTEVSDQDHVTLVFLAKKSEGYDAAVVEKVVEAARKVAGEQAPITAKVQGLAYFDGAENSNGPATALVALLDAPGLEDLHVALKKMLRAEGVVPSETHGFTPHITLCYLKPGDRVADLPQVNGTVKIDKFCVAHQRIDEVTLNGSLGRQASIAATDKTSYDRSTIMQALGEASMCWHPRPVGVFDARAAAEVGERLLAMLKTGAATAEEVAKGMKVEKEHNKDDAETKKIVEDHLREHPDYYTRLEQCFGKAADHPVDRAMERTQIDPAYIKDLRQFIRAQPDLPKIPLYHPLRGGFQGYATFTPAGKHHVVSTVLSPAMKPKGVPLSSVLAGVKVPEPKLRKEKHA